MATNNQCQGRLKINKCNFLYLMYSLLILDIIEQRKSIHKNKFHCLIKFDVVCLADELIDKINNNKKNPKDKFKKYTT